jgi:hypothetical protein
VIVVATAGGDFRRLLHVACIVDWPQNRLGEREMRRYRENTGGEGGILDRY